MNSRLIVGAIVLFTCFVGGTRVFAQASINENQTVYLYVNGSTGSDSNSGASTKPLKTIQAGVNKAIADAKAGIGTRLMIYPGTYRESVTINYKSNVPITIQATTTGKAILDGANVLTNWSKISSTVYAYSWKDTVSGCALPNGWYTGMPSVVQANEMLFVNGSPMTQVMSSSDLRPGTFYVHSAYNQVQLDPPSGTDMSTARVEISARRSTLSVNGSRNIVFRGLVFQHAASCMNQTGATIGGSSNILLDQDTADWNNWGAIGISSSSNTTVKNTTASYNGGPGLSGYEDVSTLWQNNETDYNNWRGSMIGLYDFAQGGTKLMRMHGATVSSQKAYNNASQGLWFDTDNINVTISGAKLVGNLVGNLQLEASQGPFTVQNSTFCSGGGLQLINAAGIAMTGNVFYNNGGGSFQNGQIFLAGKSGGRSVTNWQTGAVTNVYTKNTKLQNNSILAVGSGQNVFNTYLSGTDWSQFIYNLNSNGNHWYDSADSSAFGLPGGKHTNLSGWRGLSGQDSSSVWASASSSCGIPGPAYPDFQLLAHNAASYVATYAMSGGRVSIPLQVRSFGYGTVTLSARDLPSGVSASFSTASLAGGSSTLTLSASSTAISQTVPITIFGVSGNRVHTITIKVAVRPGTTTAQVTTTAQASVSPGSLSWNKVAVGNAGGQKLVTLKNSSSKAIAVSSIGFSGTNPRDFAVFRKTCGSTLAAGGSCTATILFKPTTSGTRTATLSFNDNAGNSPQRVYLTGLGTSS